MSKLNLTNLVNFQPQHRYLVFCELLSSVHEVCESLANTEMNVLSVVGSTDGATRDAAFAQFKKGSVLVTTRSFIWYGFCWDTLPGVQDIVVLDFVTTRNSLKQARHRFRPHPATVIAITPDSAINTFAQSRANFLIRASQTRTDTGMVDDLGTAIFVGDTLQSVDGYQVVVSVGEDSEFYGKLVCDDDNSCKDIPYHLNSGRGHHVVS